MAKRHIIITLFLFFGAIRCGFASDNTYYFDQLSLNEGLSQSTAKTIFRDHIGLLWIGTRDGLNKYDGNEIRKYYNQPSDTTSLPSNEIRYITEDANNTLWILTTGSLCRYDRKSDAFIRENVNGRQCVFDFALPYKNKVYFPAPNALFIYHCDKNTWEELYFSNQKQNLTLSCKIIPIDDENIYLASQWKGLFTLNLRTGELKASPIVKEKTIWDIYRDSKGNLWLSEYDKGVFCYDPAGKLIVNLSCANTQDRTDAILDIIEYEGEIWFASDGKGLLAYSPKNGTLREVKYYQNNPFNPGVKSFASFYKDSYDNLWIGAIRRGAFRVNNVYVKSFTNRLIKVSGGMGEETVLSFYDDGNGTVWIGTDGNGIHAFDIGSTSIKHYPAVSTKKVTSITRLKDNELLISLYKEGLMRFDKTTGQLSPFKISDENNRPLVWNNWMEANVLNTEDGNIYISAEKVYCYSQSAKKYKIIPTGSPDNGLIQLIKLSGKTDKVLIFNRSIAGLLDLKTQTISKLFDFPAENGALNSIDMDEAQNYWIGSTKGVYSWNPRDGKFEKLVSNRLRSAALVIADRKGTLWIGAGLNLYRYNISDKIINYYGKSDGVPQNEYLAKARLKTADGDIYLGGVNGFIKIDKDIPAKNESLPVFELLNVLLDGKKLSENRLIVKNQETTVKIPWNFTSLTVNIFINTPKLNFKRRCRYLLSGYNHSEKEIDSQSIVLERLKSGTYTLQLQYELQNDTWSEPVNILKIKVLPPWWNTWWFYLLALLAAAFTLFVLKKNAAKKAAIAREAEMQEQQKALSEEKVRFLINLSHELRTPLTLVYDPIRRMIRSDKFNEPQKAELSLIYKHTKAMKNLIDMVLDVRKMEMTTEEMHFESDDFNRWIAGIGDDFRLEADTKSIALQLDLDNALQQVDFDKDSCSKVLSNLLMNAVKFSEYGGTIRISTRKEGEYALVSVADNGDGVTEEDIPKLFTIFFQGNHQKGGTGIGLSYSKIQIERHGGDIGYRPNTPKGAIFWFRIPITQLEKTVAPTEEKEMKNDETLEKTVFAAPMESLFLPQLKDYTVLIVEDEPDLLQYIARSVAPYFKTTFTAPDGSVGLEMVKTKMPDMVISDVMMPKMNGFELCKTLKTDIEISHIPIVLLTALSDDENKLTGYKMGADQYISKPFKMEMLLNIAANIFHTRAELKEHYAAKTPQDIAITGLTHSKADEMFMNKLIALIEENIEKSAVGMDVLAQEMAMSRSLFYRKVKSITGMSANAFIVDYKIKKAMQQLVNTDLPIQEIAIGLGFEDQRYFSTLFKRHTQTTPTEYRNRKIKA